MIISDRCAYCETPHHARYICSHCLEKVGDTLANPEWLYCPRCGKELYPPKLNREQRIEYTIKLYRDE